MKTGNWRREIWNLGPKLVIRSLAVRQAAEACRRSEEHQCRPSRLRPRRAQPSWSAQQDLCEDGVRCLTASTFFSMTNVSMTTMVMSGSLDVNVSTCHGGSHRRRYQPFGPQHQTFLQVPTARTVDQSNGSALFCASHGHGMTFQIVDSTE